MHSPSLTSCFSTLILLIIKDIRQERGVHQGLVAQATGKTPNAWTKIETGQSVLTLDGLFGACNALSVQPADVMRFADRLIPIFNSARWYFQTVSLEKEEDQLLLLFLSYYKSKGYEYLSNIPFGNFSKVSIFDFCYNSFRNFIHYPTVVRYCCEPDFRKWIDDGASTPIINQPKVEVTETSRISEYNWDLPSPKPISPDE